MKTPISRLLLFYHKVLEAFFSIINSDSKYSEIVGRQSFPQLLDFVLRTLKLTVFLPINENKKKVLSPSLADQRSFGGRVCQRRKAVVEEVSRTKSPTAGGHQLHAGCEVQQKVHRLRNHTGVQIPA